MWEFMALIFTEFSKLSERMGIGDVLAVPCQEITQNRGFDVNRFHGGAKGKRKNSLRRKKAKWAGRDRPALPIHPGSQLNRVSLDLAPSLRKRSEKSSASAMTWCMSR